MVNKKLKKEALKQHQTTRNPKKTCSSRGRSIKTRIETCMLEGYLGQRALSQSNVEGITSALMNFIWKMGLPLKGVDELDV